MRNLLFIFALVTLTVATSCSSNNERRNRTPKNTEKVMDAAVTDQKLSDNNDKQSEAPKVKEEPKAQYIEPFTVNTVYFSDTISNYRKDVKNFISTMKNDTDFTVSLMYEHELIEVYTVKQKHFDEPFYIVVAQTSGEGGAYFHITKVFDVVKTEDEATIADFCSDYQSSIKKDLNGKLRIQNGVFKFYLNDKLINSIEVIK